MQPCAGSFLYFSLFTSHPPQPTLPHRLVLTVGLLSSFWWLREAVLISHFFFTWLRSLELPHCERLCPIRWPYLLSLSSSNCFFTFLNLGCQQQSVPTGCTTLVGFWNLSSIFVKGLSLNALQWPTWASCFFPCWNYDYCKWKIRQTQYWIFKNFRLMWPKIPWLLPWSLFWCETLTPIAFTSMVSMPIPSEAGKRTSFLLPMPHLSHMSPEVAWGHPGDLDVEAGAVGPSQKEPSVAIHVFWQCYRIHAPVWFVSLYPCVICGLMFIWDEVS